MDFKHMKTEEFAKAFDAALDKVLAASGEDAEQTVVQDYCHILKAKLPSAKAGKIVIDKETPYVITIDGKRFELDDLVKHNDSKNTERLMEIQALWGEVDKERVQTILNERISKNCK